MKPRPAPLAFDPGRAAEDLIYGAENLSTINHGRLCKARDIATKLVVAEVRAALLLRDIDSSNCTVSMYTVGSWAVVWCIAAG